MPSWRRGPCVVMPMFRYAPWVKLNLVLAPKSKTLTLFASWKKPLITRSNANKILSKMVAGLFRKPDYMTHVGMRHEPCAARKSRMTIVTSPNLICFRLLSIRRLSIPFGQHCRSYPMPRKPVLRKNSALMITMPVC